MEELVIIQNEQPVTTSLKVAEVYKKEHKSVTRAIRNLMAQDCTVKNFFEKSTYVNSRGQEHTMYYMNRKGYTLLVMGFEGKDALQFKLAYMEAFDKMETYIKEQASKALTKPASALDVLQGMLDQMKEQNTKILAVEQRLDKMEEEREQATERLLTTQYLSQEFAPELNERESSRRLLNDYCTSTGVKQQDAWHEVYAKLYYVYGININAYLKRPGEKSNLDVVQRIGAMPKVHAIVSTMVHNITKK